MTPPLPPDKVVLVIEDEAMLRANMVRGLAKIQGIEVAAAATVEEALVEVDRRPPDLVISDIDLPDRLGLEMVGELQRRGISAPIVFVSAYVKAYQSRIPDIPGVEVLEKPVSIDQLRQVVNEKLSAALSAPNPFGVAEYLQLAGLGKHSVVVSIRSPQVQGRIVVFGGEPWSAADQSGEGSDAFWRLAMARDCAIGCGTLKGDPGPRSLEGTMESLLLEAACRQDETAQAPPAGEETRFEELVDQGTTLFLAKQYPEALAVFQRARELRPDDRRLEANILRLTQILEHA